MYHRALRVTRLIGDVFGILPRGQSCRTDRSVQHPSQEQFDLLFIFFREVNVGGLAYEELASFVVDFQDASFVVGEGVYIYL